MRGENLFEVEIHGEDNQGRVLLFVDGNGPQRGNGATDAEYNLAWGLYMAWLKGCRTKDRTSRLRANVSSKTIPQGRQRPPAAAGAAAPDVRPRPDL